MFCNVHDWKSTNLRSRSMQITDMYEEAQIIKKRNTYSQGLFRLVTVNLPSGLFPTMGNEGAHLRDYKARLEATMRASMPVFQALKGLL